MEGVGGEDGFGSPALWRPQPAWVLCRPLMLSDSLSQKPSPLGLTPLGSSSHPSLPRACLSPGPFAPYWRNCPPAPRWPAQGFSSQLFDFLFPETRTPPLLNIHGRLLDPSPGATPTLSARSVSVSLRAFHLPSPFYPTGLCISLRPLEP